MYGKRNNLLEQKYGLNLLFAYLRKNRKTFEHSISFTVYRFYTPFRLFIFALIIICTNLETMTMDTLEKLTAEKLLSIKAVKLQPSNPFTWASGWKSPIYCDNRKLISYPHIRTFIKIELSRLIIENFPDVDAIAGVATGAISTGALVADALGLPFVYIRATPKDHGLENLIEGELKPGSKVVVVEDLVSTGNSSLKAVGAIRKDGSEVIGMVANFTYGFPIATSKFEEAGVKLITLTNYDAILAEALRIQYIAEDDLETLQEWRKSPADWE